MLAGVDPESTYISTFSVASPVTGSPPNSSGEVNPPAVCWLNGTRAAVPSFCHAPSYVVLGRGTVPSFAHPLADGADVPVIYGGTVVVGMWRCAKITDETSFPRMAPPS